MSCYRGTSAVFVKHLGRPVISILTTSAQRARRNYAASLDFLKLHSLSVGVFFGSAFGVHVTGVTKLFLVTVSETILLHLNSRVSTNSLYCC